MATQKRGYVAQVIYSKIHSFFINPQVLPQNMIVGQPGAQ